MRDFCGTVTYYGIVFDVSWDTKTKIVYVNKSKSSLNLDISYKNFTAESKEEALIVAGDVLRRSFGDPL